MEFIGFLINIAITIYLAVDARKHFKSPVLWGILGLFFGSLALGIYLIKTDRKALGWIITIISGLVHLLVLIMFGFLSLLLMY